MSSQSSLPCLDLRQHKFIKPKKQINEGHDVAAFLTSYAYRDIGLFIMQLNLAMCPRIAEDHKQLPSWDLMSPPETVAVNQTVRNLQGLLGKINAIIDEAPPDTGPRRFGNVSFRKWYEILETRISDLLMEFLPSEILLAGAESGVSAQEELSAYLLGGFGSAQRLDYGTGHELSFLAFLGCIWKLKGFHSGEVALDGSTERSIVLGVIEPYLRVIRRLILTYTLEPAGSHGVWGLDDHFFLPYIFGSAQYCPAITVHQSMPLEGSLPDSPDPGDVTKKNAVDRMRRINMYFSAVGFINDVKTGPFWEHSPILFDISGVRSGWGKINKGMIKMYNAEVLSKFPVVQHFPFGSLFSWEIDPDAAVPISTAHTDSQPSSQAISVTGNTAGAPTSRPLLQEGMKAPWAAHTSSDRKGQQAATMAPWAAQTQSLMPTTAAPWAKSTSSSAPTTMPESRPASRPNAAPSPATGMPSTRAPWAIAGATQVSGNDPTMAPWANKR